eukprot:TRINITY_DN4910_c0_g1_i1.p1 TRINITY_DN4910_c0_g1~~TRINITY_DN4910_c0_g1_i1.p1  ORF type:complete len:282 (+),score=84.43 TRINITY_DN4910_c0_g1_i1:126-971(+)
MSDPVAALYAQGILGPGGVEVHVGDGVATVLLSHPERANCLSARMTAGLVGVVDALHGSAWGKTIRVVLLRGKGRVFCSGADAKAVAGKGADAVRAQSVEFARLLRTLSALPQAVVGVADGGAFGGGMGLLACCDVVVACDAAVFSLSEVKLGMIPATISPYIVDRIGAAKARQLFVTAARITAPEAVRIGFADYSLPADGVNAFLETLIANQTLCAPEAVAQSKRLVACVKHRPFTDELIADTVDRLVAVRTGAEVRAGAKAFMAKSKPPWAAAPMRAKL